MTDSSRETDDARNEDPVLRTIREIEALAAGSDLVSFDFFDTLFVRSVLDPEDVFDIVGRKVGVPTFRELRKQAQTAAFQRMVKQGRREISYTDIYECFPDKGLDVEALKDAELEVERAILHPNEELIALYRRLIELGKPVVITSDMYLPARFFDEILAAHSLPKAEVFASSDVNATKRDYGALFDHIAERHGIEPDRILHIGDNPTSDVERARERGLRAHLYTEIRKPVSVSGGPLEHSIGTALLRRHHAQIDKASLEEFGFLVGGPAALAMLEWVRERAENDRLDMLLFLARDSYVLNEAADVLWPQTGRKHHYLLGSRTAFNLAAMRESNFIQFLPFLMSGGDGLSPYELLERIGVPAPSSQVMQDLGVPDDAPMTEATAPRIADFLFAYRWEILKIAKQNRYALFNYLHALGVRPGMRIGLVDIGWNGTTQESFERAVEPLFDVEVFGYYLCFANTPERRARQERHNMQALVSAPAFSKASIEKLYANRVAAEFLFSAPHNSVIGWELDREGRIKPQADPRRIFNGDEVASLSVASEQICNGMLKFCCSFTELRDRLGLQADTVSLVHSFVETIGSGRWRDDPNFAEFFDFDDWGMTTNKRTHIIRQ